MKKLNIRIEREGNLIPIGTITGNNSSDACFQYLPEYRSGSNPVPLSVSLPLRSEAFTAAQTACFFEGLLPEGFTRRSVAQWMNVTEGDYLSILHGLGRECLGALCVTEDEEDPDASYEIISAQQVRDLASEGATKSTELVLKSHLSLTGASGKVGLYYSENENAWYLPKGLAPSTHIVKQSHIRLDGIVTNEKLALMTAARCGIMIPYSFIINTGSGEENEVLFATRRYDRVISSAGEVISGLPRPLRLHQEDFAQAMGIPAAEKYERNEAGYMRGMFDILRQYSADPIADQLKLWDIIVFNYLIGNTDAHIKNFSLLYSKNLRSIRLAPAYDIVSTAVYEQSTRDMAFSIGGVYSLEDIDADAFQRAAKEIGMSNRIAIQRFELLCRQFPIALELSAEALASEGYPKANEIKERILKAGGIKNQI